jgi:hypothetical protein
MFGLGFSLVYIPRDAPGFGIADGRPKPLQLVAGQEPLATMLLELLDPASRIHTLGNNAAPSCKGVHAPDDRQDAVGLERHCLEFPVQPGNLRSGDLVGLDGSKFGLDDLVQQVPIENRRSDGAFSGASLERPALQQLLVDVGAGKIDIVLPLDMPKLLSIASA